MPISGSSAPKRSVSTAKPRATTMAAPKKPPVAQAKPTANGAVDKFQGNAAAKGAATPTNGLLAGFQDNFGKAKDLYNQATTRLDLNESQREQVGDARETLGKLAGKDGKWTPEDLADNVQAIKFNGFLERTAGPRIAEGKLREGFQEMTGKEVAPLTSEQKVAAKERWDALSPEEKKARQISRDELDSFKETTDMIKDRSKEKGLPESKMPNGMPVDFLKHVEENQPAWRLKLDTLTP